MLDAVVTAYNTINETGIMSIGKTGYHSVQAAKEGSKALAYLVAPIPTPLDEALAVRHAAKGLYHLFKGLCEVFQ